jgi:general secretion pathway protein E
MGVESYLISSSLLGIQAQRLVRRVCEKCFDEQPITDNERDVLGLGPKESVLVRRGVGCEECGQTGYRGRVGLYELLILDDDVRHHIANGADANVIREEAIRSGMKTLRADAIEKLKQGLTTPEEIVRVTRAI